MTSLDLWTPIVGLEQQHLYFRKLAESPSTAPERAVISSWSDGFVDRDNKFVVEFQTTFNSAFWELYLHACFKDLGFAIDLSHPAPDFLLSKEHLALSAEATTASHADGYRPEWDRDLLHDPPNIDRYEVVRSASIRIANAIAAKTKAYREKYSALPHVKGKPFLLCLAPFDQPYFFVQNDLAIRRVLYALDQPLWIEGKTPEDRVVLGQSRTIVATKDSEAQVPFGLFSEPTTPEISAVLFSTTATFSKVRALTKTGDKAFFMALRYNDHGTEATRIAAWRPEYQETLADGLHLYLNPFAHYQLDPKAFLRRGIAVHSVDVDELEYHVHMPHGFLIERMCMTFSVASEKNAERAPQRQKGRKAKAPHTRRPWPQDVLVPVGGESYVFVDHHFAHYKGWTILIALDTVDLDWGWQAQRGTFRDLPEYMEANRKSSGRKGYRTCGTFFPTKEAAYADAKLNVRPKAK